MYTALFAVLKGLSPLCPGVLGCIKDFSPIGIVISNIHATHTGCEPQEGGNSPN